MTINVRLKHGIIWHFIIVCMLMSAAAAASTLDAEETAYLRHLRNAAVSTQCRAAIENVFDQAKFHAVHDPEKLAEAQRDLGRLIDEVRLVAQKHLARVEKALPPESMRETYISRVLFLRYAKDLPKNLDPSQVDEFINHCKVLYNKTHETSQILAQRKPTHSVKGTVRLTYEPPFLPVSYNLIDGSFTVKQSFNSPLGSLSVGYTNTSGAKLLVIRSSGRERYFSLDQAFEVFVPASHGVIVQSDGNGTIILEIIQQ